MQPPVLGHERASHRGEHCIPPAGQREKGAQCPVSSVKAHSVRPLGHMQRPESKPELRKGRQRGLSKAGAGLPVFSLVLLPLHHSTALPTLPKFLLKQTSGLSLFQGCENLPVELHPTELNIHVSSVASPHLIWPWPPLLIDVMSYCPTPRALCPTCPGPWAVPEHPGSLYSLLLLHGMPFPTPSWLVPSLHSGLCTKVTTTSFV